VGGVLMRKHAGSGCRPRVVVWSRVAALGMVLSGGVLCSICFVVTWRFEQILLHLDV